MKIKYALLLGMLLCIGTQAVADDYNEARITIQKSLNQLLAAIKNQPASDGGDKQDEDEFYYMLAEEVLEVADMKLMSRLALGKHWSNTNDLQKEQFAHGFEKMIIKSYAKQAALLSDIKIEFLPKPDDVPVRKYQIIHTQVVSADGKPPLKMDYSMTNREGWKVFDFIVDGVSLLGQFRQNFDAEIQETSLTALIERLNKINSVKRLTQSKRMKTVREP